MYLSLYVCILRLGYHLFLKFNLFFVGDVVSQKEIIIIIRYEWENVISRMKKY